MLIIDTSLWVDFLRRRAPEEALKVLRQALGDRTAAYTCPVAMELLAGCRDSRETSLIRELLGMGTHLKVEWRHWERAAQLLAVLNKRGLRVPLSDVLTAAVGMVEGVPVVCRDKHYEVIRDHGGRDLEVRFVK